MSVMPKQSDSSQILVFLKASVEILTPGSSSSSPGRQTARQPSRLPASACLLGGGQDLHLPARAAGRRAGFVPARLGPPNRPSTRPARQTDCPPARRTASPGPPPGPSTHPPARPPTHPTARAARPPARAACLC
jgi:hypothetical protein